MPDGIDCSATDGSHVSTSDSRRARDLRVLPRETQQSMPSPCRVLSAEREGSRMRVGHLSIVTSTDATRSIYPLTEAPVTRSMTVNRGNDKARTKSVRSCGGARCSSRPTPGAGQLPGVTVQQRHFFSTQRFWRKLDRDRLVVV